MNTMYNGSMCSNRKAEQAMLNRTSSQLLYQITLDELIVKS